MDGYSMSYDRCPTCGSRLYHKLFNGPYCARCQRVVAAGRDMSDLICGYGTHDPYRKEDVGHGYDYRCRRCGRDVSPAEFDKAIEARALNEAADAILVPFSPLITNSVLASEWLRGRAAGGGDTPLLAPTPEQRETLRNHPATVDPTAGGGDT